MALIAAASVLVVGFGATLGPVAGIGAVAAVAAGLVVLSRPVYGAYALVVAVPALSGLRRGMPIPGFRLTEVMIVGIGLIVLVTARKAPRWGAFDWMALSYVVLTCTVVWFNVLRHGGTFTQEILGTMTGPLQFFILYRALLVALPEPEQRVRAIRMVLLVSLLVAAVTLLQQFNVAGIRPLLETLTSTNAYDSTVRAVPRATGPFPHWHNLGGYLLLVILLGVSVLLEPGQRVIRTRLLLVAILMSFAALIQTASFAPLIAAVVGVLIMGVLTGQWRRVLAWLGVAAVVGALLFGPLILNRVEQQYQSTNITQDQSLVPQTIAFRFGVWKTQFMPVIRKNLATGYGPTLPPRLYFRYAESVYVTFLLRGGVPLLLVYLGLMIALAIRARSSAAADEPDRRIVGRVLFPAVCVLLAIDTIATYFLDSGPAPLLWVLVGLMAVSPTSAPGHTLTDG